MGWWSYWLAMDFDEVFAFEPVRLHYDLLRQNVQGLNFYPSQYAVGEERCWVKMEVPEKTGRSHVAPEGEAVAMIELDYLEITDLDFLKIDVEGYEKRVLLGGEKTIRENKPVIVIEQAGHEELYYGEERDSAMKLLKEWGAVELVPVKQQWDHILGWKNEQ